MLGVRGVIGRGLRIKAKRSVCSCALALHCNESAQTWATPHPPGGSAKLSSANSKLSVLVKIVSSARMGLVSSAVFIPRIAMSVSTEAVCGRSLTGEVKSKRGRNNKDASTFGDMA